MIKDKLIYDAKIGDLNAIEEIFRNFEKILLYHGKKYFILGGNKDDIFQEASIGLIEAISSYDSNKKQSFESFAFLCIKRQLIKVIRNSNCGKNKFLNMAIYENKLDSFSYKKKSVNFYNPEEILLSKEKIKELYIYLKHKLSQKEKEIFKYLIADFTYIEIAKKLKKDIKSIDNGIQ
ncbi:TPA: sigma-70 family RNA polymerase sigma factor, partial [Salmonella enterica subsp. enterica serovar 4,[5],12:i:-]|nr:sigma-70 family RNA polymerase sigma factor [Salmonella enterica subsp. enterica serovar 4,[5],12:i:-]